MSSSPSYNNSTTSFFSPSLDAHFDSIRSSIEIKVWNKKHEQESSINQKYCDIVAYEKSIEQIVERLPMILRIEDTQTSISKKEKKALLSAIDSWQQVQDFHSLKHQDVLTTVETNFEYFDNTKVERHKAICIALKQHKSAINAAHNALLDTIRSLFEAGYTYSSFMPFKERSYYKRAK